MSGKYCPVHRYICPKCLDCVTRYHSESNKQWEAENTSLRKEVERLKELLQRGLEQMRLINGPPHTCVIGSPFNACKNHVWIYDAEQALSAEGREGR